LTVRPVKIAAIEVTAEIVVIAAIVAVVEQALKGKEDEFVGVIERTLNDMFALTRVNRSSSFERHKQKRREEERNRGSNKRQESGAREERKPAQNGAHADESKRSTVDGS
jgi:hypothetical protein